MNFYHFRPSCKVIKRSRLSRGPFFTNYCEDNVLNIFSNPDTYLTDGMPNMNFGIKYQYSRKVFVGGLPSDITEIDILNIFKQYGSLTIDWPYKEDLNAKIPPKGFVFLLFKNNYSVDKLIQFCEKKNDGFYFRVSSTNTENKLVQIRPWKLSGIDYVFISVNELNARNTIFVGGVPRTITAEQLGKKMEELFGKVAYVGIDTDSEYFYPKGAARVTFKNLNSVISAIQKRFLMPFETKTNKMMEMKPYILDDQICDKCESENETILFCPEKECLQYLCEFCWAAVHDVFGQLKNHKPFVKQGSQDYENSLRKRGYDLKSHL